MVDAIEVQNFALIERQYYEKAHFVNEKFLKKAEVSSSDCHIKINFGHTFTLFEGETAQDLKKAIVSRKTMPLSIRKQNVVQQIMGFGPCIKLPFHLSLQFAYRMVETVFITAKDTTKRYLTPKTGKQTG
jgi:hypothetical protein